MNKTFKKIAASIMAISTLAVSMVGMSANAADRNYSFSSRYIAGAPGSASFTDVAVVTASNEEYTAHCATLDIQNTTGTLTVTCTNYDMSKTVKFTQPDKYSTFTIDGSLSNGDARFPCSCYGNGTVYATGEISH